MSKVQSTIQSGQYVTLRIKNWVASEGFQTFLYAISDKNWLGVANNSMVADRNYTMDPQYIFSLEKCEGSGDLNYKDKINLKSNNKYVQCGGGTCNSGNEKSCNGTDWQIFIINGQDPGRSGPVRFGDSILLTSHGFNCNILPADASLVWCGSSVNANEIFEILPTNGTLFETAKESQKEYDVKRDLLLKQKDGAQSDAKQFLKNLTSPTMIIIMVLCCLMSVSFVASVLYIKFK